MLASMPRDIVSPFRVLDEDQTRRLRLILRFHEVLTNSEYAAWATDHYADVTRPLHELASELHRRADTQVVTRHPAHYDDDVKNYIRIALAVGALTEPQQGKDGPAPTLLRLLSPLMDEETEEASHARIERDKEIAALRAEIEAEKLHGPSEAHLDETEFLDYVDPHKEEEEEDEFAGRSRW